MLEVAQDWMTFSLNHLVLYPEHCWGGGDLKVLFACSELVSNSVVFITAPVDVLETGFSFIC